MGLKHLFEKIEPHFTEGKLKKYYPLYEATATIFYTPGLVTKGRRTSVTPSTSSG
jgi:Na+-transporting NADH:ubiquinone oxidoreductase subunit B